MALSFNTSGPCIPGEHYMLPPERRLGHVMGLVEERRFFTLHAGRQTGKTTSLMWLEQHFGAIDEGQAWRALWVDVEAAREQPDPALAFRSVLNCFGQTLAWHPEIVPPDRSWIEGLLADPPTAILEYLHRLAELDPRPLLLLVDEVDGLVGPAMVSFLTQLRQGYIARRRRPFPTSVVRVLTARARRALADFWSGSRREYDRPW